MGTRFGAARAGPTRWSVRGALALAALVSPACERPRPEPLVLRVLGSEFEWHVRHPGPDRTLDTPDDVLVRRDLHIPRRRPVEIRLESADYIYGFRIPDLGVNEMAVPDLDFRAYIDGAEAGLYGLLGDQMCGYAHESLIGRVIVHTQREYDEWIEAQKSASP